MNISQDDIKAITQVLNSEAGKNLTVPITKEIGIFLGDLGNMARFYATDNLNRVAVRWAEHRNNRKLTDEEVKRVMPLLPMVSMQSNEEFTDQWAALLESAANGSNPYAAAHAQTLSQLTPEEARVLSHLHKERLAASDLPRSEDSPVLRFVNVFQREDRFLCISFGVFDKESHSTILFESVMDDRIRLLVSDLERLRLIDPDGRGLPKLLMDANGITHPKDVGLSEGSTVHRLSNYGKSFMKAVVPNPE
jgi:hypothetical protein